jgi:hypothetical protein
MWQRWGRRGKHNAQREKEERNELRETITAGSKIRESASAVQISGAQVPQVSVLCRIEIAAAENMILGLLARSHLDAAAIFLWLVLSLGGDQGCQDFRTPFGQMGLRIRPESATQFYLIIVPKKQNLHP